jgi:hypothetical protein
MGNKRQPVVVTIIFLCLLVAGRVEAAKLFTAGLTGTSDFDTVTVTGGNTVAAGTLTGWPNPFLTFTGDGVDAGAANNAYVQKDLGSNKSQLLVRLIVEYGTDYNWNDTIKLIQLVNPDGSTEQASVAALASDQYISYIRDNSGTNNFFPGGSILAGETREIWLSWGAGGANGWGGWLVR